MGLLLLGLVACQPEIVGSVADGADAPVVGATLAAAAGGPCVAVTGPDGRFHARCDREAQDFTLSHPDHLPRAVAVDLPARGTVDLGVLRLAPLPARPGLHRPVGEAWEALPAAPLVRRGSDAEGWRWCVEAGEPPTVPAGEVELVDVHAADWKLFRVDAEGCIYRMTPTVSGYWHAEGASIPVTLGTPLAPGRDRVSVTLEPGDYVFADWFASGFVAEGDGRWRASWLRVAAPAGG